MAGKVVQRFIAEHTGKGLRRPGAPAAAGRRRRGGDRTARRPGRGHAAGGRVHRGGDQPEPAEEPARPLRVGGQQGRPVRRVRAGRHAAHRPGPAAPAAAGQPGHRHLAAGLPGPQGSGPPPRRGVPTSCAPTSRSPSPARSACSPTSTPRSAWRSWPASTARTGPTGCRRRRLAAWLEGRLLRPQGPRRTARPPGRRTPRRHRRRRQPPKRTSPAPCSPSWPASCEQIKALNAQIAEQLALHADAHIFTILPRSGTVRAARLLAEIGDCRARFPTPESLVCLAGVAPSTRKSGKTTPSASAGPPTSNSATPSRLRRRLPPRQPLGRPPLQRAIAPRQRPPPRHPHPRPRLAVRHLALLAEPHRLRPRPAQSPPAPPRPRKTGSSLTQGYS